MNNFFDTMAIKEEVKERLEKRLQIIKEAKTPMDLAYTIWSKSFEEATGSSKQDYRNCFVEWIEVYKENRPPNLWYRYKNPIEVVNDIWKPFLDNNETDKLWFGSLRSELVKWINIYCDKLPI